MDEHDVVEAGTDLLLGDPKSALKKIGLSVFDKKQFEAIFVSAGKRLLNMKKITQSRMTLGRFCSVRKL